MKKTDQTPAQRIEAMKKKAQEEADRLEQQRMNREKLNERRTKMRAAALNQVREQLNQQAGLPVICPETAMKKKCVTNPKEIKSSRHADFDDVEVTVLAGHSGILIRFVISVDEEPTAHLYHDDDEITADQALDLATAAVELAFAVGKKDRPTEDSTIPF